MDRVSSCYNRGIILQSTIEHIRELSQMSTLKAFLALISSWVLEAVGHPNSAATVLFALLICDLLLGLIRAWKSNTLCGDKIKLGAFKFFRYWLAIAIFVLVDKTINKAFPFIPTNLHDIFIAYLAVSESFSCVDHLAFFGMPIPEAFLKKLHGYREKCLETTSTDSCNGKDLEKEE